jgi:hypothetical protein
MTPEKFIDSAWSTVCDLSLFLANQPDHRVVATLNQMRSNLNKQMSAVFPRQQAVAIVDHIMDGIQARRHEIEERSGGATIPTRH